jgi:translation initiation factor 1
MNETCPVCGLPKELCVCETIAKEQQKIQIRTDKKRFGKIVTVVEGIDEKQIDAKKLTKTLKQKLACGGTFKDGTITLQGEHVENAKRIMVGMGYSPDLIETKR